jgi:transposase
MKRDGEVFVAFDVAKSKHAVAVAEAGRDGEIRWIGEISSKPEAVAKQLAKLTARYSRLHVCYEAGPTGYGLYRQIRELGHECSVVAPALIPRKPGEQVKTNRRDALALVRLLRAGELTAVWVPDRTHELPGRRRCDRRCEPARPRPRVAAGRDRAELVHGAGGRGVSGHARGIAPGCRDLCCGDWRCPPL